MCPYGKVIHVVGVAGTEGAALLQYLHQKYPKVSLVAHNSGPRQQFIKAFRLTHIALGKANALQAAQDILELENVRYCFGDEYLSDLDEADTIFVPQSWYLYKENAVLEGYREKFRSITRLYFDLFPGKIIGVTGSNGKTTTTNFIAEVMQRFHPQTLFSGNDRRANQVLSQIEESSAEDWLVLEISNRQLMIDLGKSPDIGVITNITPNHLQEYENFAAYARCKASLLQHQTEDQWSVLNWDDPESRKLIEIDGGETFPFSTKEQLSRGVFVHFGKIIVKHADEKQEVMPVADFPLKGEHNLSNALATIAACYLADVPLAEIAQTLRSLEPIPQRMEFVQKVQQVEYYNDTASTVPESTIAAIKALKKEDGKLILIAGGSSKGSEYQQLAETIDEHVATVLFLKSPVAEELSSFVNKAEQFSYELLQEAVQKAQEISTPNDVVLFSPAAEYFVYFKDKMPGYKNFRHMVSNVSEE